MLHLKRSDKEVSCKNTKASWFTVTFSSRVYFSLECLLKFDFVCLCPDMCKKGFGGIPFLLPAAFQQTQCLQDTWAPHTLSTGNNTWNRKSYCHTWPWLCLPLLYSVLYYILLVRLIYIIISINTERYLGYFKKLKPHSLFRKVHTAACSLELTCVCIVSERLCWNFNTNTW